MFDPEFADGAVFVGEGEAVSRFGVREAGGVEVQAEALRFRPGNPVLEVVDFDGVAVDLFAAEFAVAGVQVQAVFAGNEGERHFQIGSEFFGGAGFAGVISGNGDAAAEGLGGVFEAGDVVALPAVEGDGDGGELAEGGFGIDAEGGVAFLSEAVGVRKERFLVGGCWGGHWEGCLWMRSSSESILICHPISMRDGCKRGV